MPPKRDQGSGLDLNIPDKKYSVNGGSVSTIGIEQVVELRESCIEGSDEGVALVVVHILGSCIG